MLSFFVKILALLMAVIVYTPTNAVGTPMTAKENGVRLNVTVVSDAHMEGNNRQRFKGEGRAMEDWAASETPIDALVMVGDNTMNGQDIEYMLLYGMLNRYAGVDRILMAPGNHDLCKNSNDPFSSFNMRYRRFVRYNKQFFGTNENGKAYFSRDINGYRLIIMANEKESGVHSYHSPEQLAWLNAELKAAEASGKPAFVFNHNHLGSVWGSDWGESGQETEIKAALESVDTAVFYISGHRHWDADRKTVNNVTYVNVPEFGNVDGKMGRGFQMEVYDDEVIFRLRNYTESRWEGYEFSVEL